MPHRKPVQVTTTTHAYVLTWYAMLTVLGILHVADIAAHQVMTDMVGPTWTDLWAMGIVVSGITATIGAIGSRLLANPTMTLWVEAVGVAGLVLTAMPYVGALWLSLGAGAVLATQVPQWAVVLGGIGRIAQIGVEARRIRRAIMSPAPALPPPLGLVEADE